MCVLRSFAALLATFLLASSVCQAKHENWIEVRSPNFIVVSNAGEKQARKAALQFEQIRAVFRQSLRVASSHPSPVVTVLAAKDEGSMRELLPEYWAKGHAHPAGLFATQLNQCYAAVELDAQGTSPYETFYHEYYHSITIPYFPDLPVWLSEGLAELYGHTEINDNYVGMGQADPLHLQQLKTGYLIPLNVLFKVDQSSPYYNEADKTSMFYAESWALSHYLMVGDRGAHRAMLTAYLGALDQGKNQDEAATLAFGDLKKLQTDLQVYIHSATFLYMRMPPTKIDESELKVRPLSDAEAEAYRGGFFAVRGRSQDATVILEEAARLDPNVALAHEYLGMAEFLQGQQDKAVESASKAIALDSRNSFTRYLRAFLQTRREGMGSGDPQIEEDLRQAIAISPDFAPPYGLLAVHLAATGRKLEEAQGLAEKAIAFEPGSSDYQLALAQVLIREKKLNEAEIASKRANTWARNPAEKANAQSFQQFLDKFRQLQSEIAARGTRETEIMDEDEAPGSAPSESDHAPTLKIRTQGENSSGSGPPGAAKNPFSATVLRVQSSITLVGNPLGVDFNPYLKNVMAAIQKNLMPAVEKVHLDQAKDVTLELAIQKDGSISGVTLVSGSGDEALDEATGSGISASSPLPALPAAFKGQSLQLHIRFSYSEERR